MLELVRRAALVVLWFIVALRIIVGDVVLVQPRRSQARQPRGMEYRALKRVGSRIVAVQIRLVIA